MANRKIIILQYLCFLFFLSNCLTQNPIFPWNSFFLNLLFGNQFNVSIQPLDLRGVVGDTIQYSATLSKNGVLEDITSEVVWEATNPSVVQFSQIKKGEAYLVGLGETEICLRPTLELQRRGLSESILSNFKTKGIVSAPPQPIVTITPNNSSDVVGAQVQFVATITFPNGSTEIRTADMTWSSSDTTIIEAVNPSTSPGLFEVKGVGSATISIAPIDTVAYSSITINSNTEFEGLQPPDTTPPNLVSVSPLLNGTALRVDPRRPQVELLFDEDLDSSVVPRLVIRDISGVEDPLLDTISSNSFTFSWNPLSATDGPTATRRLRINLGNLPSSARIRWHLDRTSFRDLAGNTLSSSSLLSGTNSGTGNTEYYEFFTQGESYNLGLNIRDTGQSNCYNSSGTNVSCGSLLPQVLDGSIQNSSARSMVQSYTFQSGFPNDPITRDTNSNRTFTTCRIGEIWNTSTTSCENVSLTARNWKEAFNECRRLDDMNSGQGYSGRRGWRLPSLREMYSVLDFARISSLLVSQSSFPTFGNSGSVSYWTLTGSKGRTAAYRISPLNGRIAVEPKVNASLGSINFYNYCVYEE